MKDIEFIIELHSVTNYVQILRLNTTQTFIQELNWIGHCVKQTLSELTNNKDRIKLLSRFLKACHHDEFHDAIIEDYMSKCPAEQDEFFDEIIKDRIYIMQEPMDGITGDNLGSMYGEFNPKPSNIYVTTTDGKFKLRRKAIVAEEYILILKHLGSSKFSVRGKSLINPKTSLPSKSLKAKKKKIIYPDQAIKIGEQEFPSMIIINSQIREYDMSRR